MESDTMGKGIWLRLAAPIGGLLLVGGVVWGLLGASPEKGPADAARDPTGAPASTLPVASGGFVETNWSHLEEGDPRAVRISAEKREGLRVDGERAIEDLRENFRGTLIVEVKERKL